MQTINLWHKLYLHGRKGFLILLLLCMALAMHGQQKGPKPYHLPNYDDRLIHYGFFLGGHISNFRLRYADGYTSTPNLHSVVPVRTPGFNLGFIVNLNLAQYLDLRALPTVGLHQYSLEYNAVGSGRDSINVGTKEAFYAGLPLLIKYKSQRRDNFRMYVVGGLSPTFEVSSFDDDEQAELLLVKRFDLRYEIGFGVDIYFPLFKFSPEIRYSHGLINMLRPIDNTYSNPIDRLSMHNVSIYFQFQ